MSTQVDSTANPKLLMFQGILASLANDPTEAQRFAGSVKTPEDLAVYCGEKGLPLTQDQATTLFGALREAETLARQAGGGDRTLNDAELETVDGGVSWALVGLGAGLVLGAVTGGVGLALAGAAFEVVGTAILGSVAGGVAGGAGGAAIGGIAQAVKNAFD